MNIVIKILAIVILLTFAVFASFIIVSGFGGCAIHPQPAPHIQPTPGALPDVVTKIIYQTNWLTTIAMIGVALSVAAFVNGASYALPLFAGCSALLATILTIARYSQWIAFAGFAVAIVVFGYTTFVKNKSVKNLDTAFKEVVSGAQKVKDDLLDKIDTTGDLRKKANAILSVQSPTTVDLVQKVKDGLIPKNEGTTNV